MSGAHHKLTNMKKVLIADDVHPVLVESLRNSYEVQYEPEIDQFGVEMMLNELSGIVINSKTTIHRPQMDKAWKLEWIARLGSGLEIIDTDYALLRGIEVIRTPGANANAVAEHALGMLLALSSQICLANHSMKQGLWEREKHRGFELEGKTIGIIGFGETGSRFAKRLSGFDVEILVFDPYRQRIEESHRFVHTVELEELRRRSDVISFHVPLGAETTHYFDAEFAEICKPGVIIINTSRGGVVDEEFLVAAMKKDFVGGACLDVFEHERPPRPNSKTIKYLRQSEKAILSPHVAGWTIESKKNIAQSIVDQLTSACFLSF